MGKAVQSATIVSGVCSLNAGVCPGLALPRGHFLDLSYQEPTRKTECPARTKARLCGLFLSLLHFEHWASPSKNNTQLRPTDPRDIVRFCLLRTVEAARDPPEQLLRERVTIHLRRGLL